MESLSAIEDVILSTAVFSGSDKVGGDSQVLKDFISAYLEMTSSSYEHLNALKDEELGYNEADDMINQVNENVTQNITNMTNDHVHLDDTKASKKEIIIHSPMHFHALYDIDDKEVISEFQNGSFNRTRIYGDRVMEFSTSEFIQGPHPMTKHVTVFFNGDGVSKPIVEERFEPEDRELCVDGIKQKSKNEENKDLMEEMLKDIEYLNSMEIKRKGIEERRRREESIKLLKCLEETESENEKESNVDSEGKETELIEMNELNYIEKNEKFESPNANQKNEDCEMLHKNENKVIDKMNDEMNDELDYVEVVYGHNQKINDVEIIDIDELNGEDVDDEEMKRLRYEHHLESRVAEFVDNLVQVAQYRKMAENDCDVAKPNPQIFSLLGMQNDVDESVNDQYNRHANGFNAYGHGCYDKGDELHQINEQVKAFEPSFQQQPNAHILGLLGLKNNANDSMNEYSNVYSNDYANDYANDFANVYGNEFENIYYNYDSSCYERNVGLNQFHNNECFENNAYDYVGCDDGVFYDPIYKSNVMNGVGFDD